MIESSHEWYNQVIKVVEDNNTTENKSGNNSELE